MKTSIEKAKYFDDDDSYIPHSRNSSATLSRNCVIICVSPYTGCFNYYS